MTFVLGTTLQPNPNLLPERADNYEFGFNVLKDGLVRDDDSFRMKFAYFNNSYDDYIVRTSINNNNRSPYHWDNIHSAKFKGVELSLKYDMRTFFIEGALTRYTDVEYCLTADSCVASGIGTDYGANYVPPKLWASLSAGARFFDEKLVVGARVTHFSERAINHMTSNVTNPTLWPETTIVDLFGSYEVNDNFSINVSAENIADKYYLDALSINTVPAPGRTIKAGLTAKF